jgi:GDP/UDP-N,N'-diacetylbacillosamine 2-epimerase (hydrolysing)
VSKNKDIAVSFKSLGQVRYLSGLQHVDVVLGNSSSGIIEVPYFNIPTINIGDRQKGRVMAESVINTKPKKDDIIKALEESFDVSFIAKIKNQKQLYGGGDSVNKIMKVLSVTPTEDLKKSFYDIKF